MFLGLTIAVALCGAVVQALDCEPGAVHLDRSGMGRTVFPNLTMCATTLETLYLSNNYITEIPASIGNLTVLRELRIDSNQLHSLPDEVGNLVNLRQLWVDQNYLGSLPQSFANLTQLELVRLTNNPWSEFPPQLLSLANLQSLHLEGTSIDTLPPQLGNLINVKEVWLSFNYALRSVPAELGNWQRLETFYVYHTQVSCLPKSMIKLPYFQFGNHLPTCTNNTISGYVVQRARKHGTCGGPVRNVTGFATGCTDQVRTTCEEQDGNIVVTQDRLSDLDSRSLTCQADAPIASRSTVTYPRCDEYSGVASSCADPDIATEIPFPQKHPGMVTLGFADYENCDRKAYNTDFSRRLTTAAETDAALESDTATQVQNVATAIETKSVRARDHYRPRPDRTAFKAALEAKLQSERVAREVEARRNAAAARARAGKRPEDTGYICEHDTEIAYIFADSTPAYDLRNCTALRFLQIYGFDADYLATQIPYLPVLEDLSLQNNGPMELPANLHELRSLARLEVMTAYGDSMPGVLRNMTQLSHLRYTEAGTYGGFFLPDWFAELTNLRSLDLSGNRFFYQFPHVVTQMVNLRNLSLSGLQLEGTIPESITNLVNLHSLDLSYNWMGKVPAFLGRMTHLRVLNLASCGLSTLPATFGNLVSLNTLALYGNYISCLPEEVRQLYARNPEGLWNLQSYSVCPPTPLPLTFVHQRNAACLWDPYYEFWYRAVCDNSADTLAVTLYADSACRKKAKRAAVHGLHQQFPDLGYCAPPRPGARNSFTSYAFGVQYCHN